MSTRKPATLGSRIERQTMIVAAAFLTPLSVTLISPWLAREPAPLLLQPAPAPDPALLAQMGRAWKPSESQIAAEARAMQIGSAAIIASPLFYPADETPATPLAVDDKPPAPVIVNIRPEAPMPQFTVSSIFRTANGQVLAVINGKMRRIGEDLGGGWLLVDVDPTTREIKVQHGSATPRTIAIAETDL